MYTTNAMREKQISSAKDGVDSLWTTARSSEASPGFLSRVRLSMVAKISVHTVSMITGMTDPLRISETRSSQDGKLCEVLDLS